MRAPFALALAFVLLAGCRITPDEVARIEAENQLLRQEVQVIKENCAYYRELELRPEQLEGGGESDDAAP